MKNRTVKKVAVNQSDTDGTAPSNKYQPKSTRYYFDVGLGSIILSGKDTGGEYCLLEIGLALGMSVPRHTHTREDEAWYVLSGELKVVVVGGEVFILRAGDTLIGPRNIPHQLHNSGNAENHCLIMFSSSGFEEFLKGRRFLRRTMRLLQRNQPALAVRNVLELAAGYGIHFG